MELNGGTSGLLTKTTKRTFVYEMSKLQHHSSMPAVLLVSFVTMIARLSLDRRHIAQMNYIECPSLQVRVDKLRPLAKIGFMHVIATNWCVWVRAVVRETFEATLVDKYGTVHYLENFYWFRQHLKGITKCGSCVQAYWGERVSDLIWLVLKL